MCHTKLNEYWSLTSYQILEEYQKLYKQNLHHQLVYNKLQIKGGLEELFGECEGIRCKMKPSSKKHGEMIGFYFVEDKDKEAFLIAEEEEEEHKSKKSVIAAADDDDDVAGNDTRVVLGVEYETIEKNIIRLYVKQKRQIKISF